MENFKEVLIKEKNTLSNEIKSYEDILRKSEKAKQRIAIIDDLLKTYADENENVNGHEVEIVKTDVSEYDNQWTWVDKCLYALKLIGSGYTSDVVDKITELEPTLDPKRAKEACAFYLSKLLGTGKIKKVGQSGRKYKFSLN